MKNKSVFFVSPIIEIIFLLLLGCNSVYSSPNYLSTIIGMSKDNTPDVPDNEGISATLIPSAIPISSITPSISISNTILPTQNTIEVPNILIVFPIEHTLNIITLKKPAITLNEIVDPNDPILISDDNHLIVYEVFGKGLGHELNVVNIDGTENRTITQSDSLEANDNPDYLGNDLYNLQWIPSTHKLLFSAIYLIVGRPNWLWYRDLFAINVDTGSLNRIYSAGEGGDAWPSPDANKIVVIQRKSLYLASNNWNILYQEIIKYRDYTNMPSSIVWSFDSSKFGTIVSENNQLYDLFKGALRNNDDANVWVINALSGKPVQMTTIHNFGSGIISPTLDYIGYSLMGENDDLYNTYISSIDGTIIKLLASGTSEFISFSPDGLHFAYAVDSKYNEICGRGNYQQYLYIGSLDGKTAYFTKKLNNKLIKWINNSQFVYVSEDSLLLGDITGNVDQIVTLPNCIQNIEARDLNFQKN